MPDDRQTKFRIGINVGDIIVDAPRLEALAGTGGIECSTVRHQIGNKLQIEFIDQGEKAVKNLAQPVHVYLINLGSSHPTGVSPALNVLRHVEDAKLLQRRRLLALSLRCATR